MNWPIHCIFIEKDSYLQSNRLFLPWETEAIYSNSGSLVFLDKIILFFSFNLAMEFKENKQQENIQN